MNNFEKLSIEERIKVLHTVIDDLQNYIKIDFEITQHHVSLPGAERTEIVIPTGEVTISITAYNPTEDGRCKSRTMTVDRTKYWADILHKSSGNVRGIVEEIVKETGGTVV